uniref:Latent-transforming growth factor beta-binding protein 1 n=1 Tax=Stegastes partitus TaxID=144197 RepID=A0A3B5B9M9_9TELE
MVSHGNRLETLVSFTGGRWRPSPGGAGVLHQGALQTITSFVCPLLCKNGGVCLQQDRCLCPPNFTGKFCHIPVAPTAAAASSPASTNEIVKPALLSVRVQHPAEASVSVHQVLKVSGFGPTLRTLSSSSSSGSAGAPAPGGGRVQAQTVRGDGVYTQHSGFKYCFREVKDGQCSSPLPGLRSREMCCRGIGKAWGITDCVLCPDNTGDKHTCNTTTHKVTIKNMGSYSCVCRPGFILDASHGLCISHSVISEEKGQCYRVLGSGLGPSSCSLPILRNITKQICCCSRVGKAWGPDCQRCPYFGSVAFKEICPAGPGYHYSASAVQFNQRVTEQLGSRGASTSPAQPQPRPLPQPLPRPQPQPQPQPHLQSRPAAGSPSRPAQPGSTTVTQVRPGAQQNQPDSAPSSPTQLRPQPPSAGTQDVNECVQSPGVCSVGECVNSAGSFRCVCPSGYRSSSQQTSCQDIDECRQAPCSNGRCENTPGSYRCVCRHGYKLQNNTCTDVDECAEPSQCPGQMCVNSVGSYRCVSCQRGYTLTDRHCTGTHTHTHSHTFCRSEAVFVGRVHCGADDDVSAADIDECLSASACEADRVCVNTVGAFRCDCRPGYRTSGLGRQCRDINECLEGDFCFSRGECVNTPGSYTCVCSQGFTLSDNRTSCLDVDECAKPGVCSDGRCLNTEGSFRCQCDTGFTANPERNACSNRTSSPSSYALNVDECVSSGGSVCGLQRCENTIGSFRCLTSCEPGYQVVPGGGCVDVNECTNTTVCGEHAFCQNLIGTYLCVCDQGFISTADGKACEDEDECVSLPGVCGSARCENMEGSFMCECDRAGEEFDTTARRCVGTTGLSPTIPPPRLLVVELAPMLPPLPAARPGELRECYYNLAERGTCSLLATNTSQQECCCTVGEGWGLGCQYHTCPAADTAEFLSLCPSGRGYTTAGAGAFSYRGTNTITPLYGAAGEGDYGPPDGSRTPSFRLPPDPRAEISFGARPPPPSRPDGPPLSLAPLPGAPRYEEEEEEEDDRTWRPGPPFPPFTGDRSRGGAAPRRLYESESTGRDPGNPESKPRTPSSSCAAEDCGIVNGCENGRCIRVAEGYTCDCYQGYELDMTSMTCIDINECEDGVGVEFPCVNARCVNTDGSFRCVCRRGYDRTGTR